MDEKQKKWNELFWNNFGPREFVRLYSAIVIWSLLWLAVDVLFELPSSVTGAIAVLSIFGFPILARWWKPAYLIFRKILGNQNLPIEPAPRGHVNWSSHSFKWWHFIILGWAILMNLILFYFVIQYVQR